MEPIQLAATWPQGDGSEGTANPMSPWRERGPQSCDVTALTLKSKKLMKHFIIPIAYQRALLAIKTPNKGRDRAPGLKPGQLPSRPVVVKAGSTRQPQAKRTRRTELPGYMAPSYLYTHQRESSLPKSTKPFLLNNKQRHLKGLSKVLSSSCYQNTKYLQIHQCPQESCKTNFPKQIQPETTRFLSNVYLTSLLFYSFSKSSKFRLAH